MSIFATMIPSVFVGAEGVDPARSVHWLWPEQAELIYGTISSLIIFALLWKFGGPAVKKAMSDRTERIQEELDASASAKTTAEAEAADIRTAAGDIDGERQRLFAEADVQAEALLVAGRANLEQEVIDLHAKAEADIASAGSRVNDELRAEISRLSSVATERLLAGGVIDAATQQDLIEGFISKVGATR
jgi:F-type H+-transporting ATPase subunit b